MQQNNNNKEEYLKKLQSVQFKDWVTNVQFLEGTKQLLTTQGSSLQNKILIGNQNELKDKYEIQGQSDQITCIEISQQDNLLAIGSIDKFVRLYDLNTGGQLFIFQNEEVIQTVQFLRQQNKKKPTLLFVGSMDQKIHIYNCQNGQLVNVILGHENWIQSILFSDDGKKMVTGDMRGGLKLWDLIYQKDQIYPQVLLKHQRQDSKNYYISLKFIKQQNSYYLHAVSTNKLYTQYEINQEGAINIVNEQEMPDDLYLGQFNYNCQYFIYGTKKGEIILYDLKEEQSLQKIQSQDGHSSSVFCVKFSDDYSYLLSGGIDNQAILWEIQEQNGIDLFPKANQLQNNKGQGKKDILFMILALSFIMIIIAYLFQII